jgi:SAM-dependent methyltransferase
MTKEDIAFVRKLLAAGALDSPVLELGAGYGGDTCRDLVRAARLDYVTTDIVARPGVDIVADFESDDIGAAFPTQRFGAVLALNVLEHVFEPVKVLDNALKLVRRGGKVVACTPCMWPVHNYPQDCQRLLPDWHRTYAARRPHARLIEDYFEFVGKGPVSAFAVNGESHLPPPWKTDAQRLYARLVNRLFNTATRGQWAATHIAIGAVFERL